MAGDLEKEEKGGGLRRESQALQMLKEHPTYRDDEEIRGMQEHTCIYSLE